MLYISSEEIIPQEDMNVQLARKDDKDADMTYLKMQSHLLRGTKGNQNLNYIPCKYCLS